MKLNRKNNLIKQSMPYKTIKNDKGDWVTYVASNKDTLDYITLKSAYNPNFEDAGKVVKLPEAYLYKSKRNHLKDFVIVDGKDDDKGNKVIMGFLASSQINKKNIKLTTSGSPTEIIAISNVVIDKNRYHKLIKKSKTKLSNRTLNEVQLEEIKKQSKTVANVRKSKKFRN